jgi:hypothetical protein
MVQDRERIEEPETDCRHNEQIHRGDSGVVAEEGLPVLARWRQPRTMYLATVDRATSTPSFSNLPSPTARSKTQGFARAIKRLQPKIGEPAARRQPRPGPAPVSQRKSGFNAKDDCGIATSRSFIATPFQIILQEAWARASTPSNMITERVVFY